MPGSEPEPRPATLVVASVVLVLAATSFLARLPTHFTLSEVPTVWVLLGVTLAIGVGIGGLAAATGLLDGRRKAWYGAMALAGLFIVAGLVTVAEMLRSDPSGIGAPGFETSWLLHRFLLGPGIAIQGAIIALMLWIGGSRDHCAVEA